MHHALMPTFDQAQACFISAQDGDIELLRGQNTRAANKRQVVLL